MVSCDRIVERWLRKHVFAYFTSKRDVCRAEWRRKKSKRTGRKPFTGFLFTIVVILGIFYEKKAINLRRNQKSHNLLFSCRNFSLFRPNAAAAHWKIHKNYFCACKHDLDNSPPGERKLPHICNLHNQRKLNWNNWMKPDEWESVVFQFSRHKLRLFILASVVFCYCHEFYLQIWRNYSTFIHLHPPVEYIFGMLSAIFHRLRRMLWRSEWEISHLSVDSSHKRILRLLFVTAESFWKTKRFKTS